MPIHEFVKGTVLGFSIAAPVGPIGLLCIRESLAAGSRAGLCAGLGAATADALYGLVAAFGLTMAAGALQAAGHWPRLLGGVFLIYLGVRTLLAAPPDRAARAGRGGLLGIYASTLLLTLTNPMTILSFAAVFAGLGLAVGASPAKAASLVAGVFSGSALWWLILSTGAGLFRSRISPRTMKAVNVLSGLIICGFGLAALLALRA